MSAKAKTIELPASDRRLLDNAQVCAFLSISHDSLDRIRDDPDERFPQPLQILRGKHLWSLADIEHYVDRKRKERDALNRN